MFQRYAYGFLAVYEAIGGDDYTKAQFYAMVSSIDPDWRINMAHRWASKPASLQLTGPAPDSERKTATETHY